MLQNEYLTAKIGVDTAENEPWKGVLGRAGYRDGRAGRIPLQPRDLSRGTSKLKDEPGC